jgi:hypothetical protein
MSGVVCVPTGFVEFRPESFLTPIHSALAFGDEVAGRALLWNLTACLASLPVLTGQLSSLRAVQSIAADCDTSCLAVQLGAAMIFPLPTR